MEGNLERVRAELREKLLQIAPALVQDLPNMTKKELLFMHNQWDFDHSPILVGKVVRLNRAKIDLLIKGKSYVTCF